MVAPLVVAMQKVAMVKVARGRPGRRGGGGGGATVAVILINVHN